MPTLVAYLCVFAGGIVGALARFGSQEAFRKWTPLPGWAAIFVVNAAGSLAIGFAVAWLQGVQLDAELQHLSPLRLYIETQNANHGLGLLAVGFCGAFTTFSTFSLDNQFLFHGKRGQMLFNALGSVLVCLALAALGWHLGQPELHT